MSFISPQTTATHDILFKHESFFAGFIETHHKIVKPNTWASFVHRRRLKYNQKLWKNIVFYFFCLVLHETRKQQRWQMKIVRCHYWLIDFFPICVVMWGNLLSAHSAIKVSRGQQIPSESQLEASSRGCWTCCGVVLLSLFLLIQDVWAQQDPSLSTTALF